MKSKLNALAARRGEKPIVDRGVIETKLYHRCRNPKCRVKLSPAADNPRKAFCCRGCYNGFYKTRCVVCEHDKPARSTDRRVVCKRPKCKSQYQRNRSFFDYPLPTPRLDAERSKNANELGTKTGQFGARVTQWRRLSAGPTLTPLQLRAAVVPDGPDCQWAGGSIERIEAANRRALEAHFDKLDSTAIDYCSVCGRDDDLVDYRVGDQWVTTCREHRASPAAAPTANGVSSDWKPCVPSSPIADDLTIPEFLRRGGDR